MINSKKYFFIILGIALLSAFPIFFLISNNTTGEKSNDPEYAAEIVREYKIYSPVIPKNLTFAGEHVPVDTYYVYEALDRELLVNTYWQSNLILLIKRAYRFFPIIEPILKEEGVHEDFKYLALIESSFTNVASPAGAAGFWQFMKATGERFKLEITNDVDERYDLVKSTYAACSYLKILNRQFSSWTSAAAAYNMGEGGLRRQMTQQKQDNYWDLHLNSETSRYVSRILALKIIIETPKQYGLHLRLSDMYQPIPMRQIEVDTSITSLIDFAIANKSNYRVLKEFNPWLRSATLPNPRGKKYVIQLPEIGYESRARQLSKLKSKNLLFGSDSIVVN
jgi:membrane-bound lytic murein transglycosylase D